MWSPLSTHMERGKCSIQSGCGWCWLDFGSDSPKVDHGHRPAVTDDPLAVLAERLGNQDLNVVLTQGAFSFQFLEDQARSPLSAPLQAW